MVQLSPDAPLSIVDATVHLFYELDEATFRAAVKGLRALKAQVGRQTACQPLGVHPTLASEGLTGAFAQAIHAWVLEYCGKDTLSRVAVMQLLRFGSDWSFSAFDIVAGTLTADEIARIKPSARQTFHVSDVAGVGSQARPTAKSSKLDTLFSESKLMAATQMEVDVAYLESFRIENPKLEHAESIDCVSCHVAGRVRKDALKRRPGRPASRESQYLNRGYALDLPSDPLGVLSQRVFGYFDSRPSFTARVVHESAEAARRLEREFP